VEDVVNLTGYHLELSFDPTVVQVINVVNGEFLDGAADEAFYEPTNEIDNVNGFISFGMVQQNSQSDPMTPKSGAGDLILITIQAISPNETALFSIDANNSMLVDWPDAFSVEFSTTNGSVSTESCPPTNLELSKALVPENEPAGTEVGTFSCTDPDTGDTCTYSLVDTTSYPDNAAFSISGDRLLTAEIFDYETKLSYTIKVRVTDGGGKYYERTFTISIEDVNEAPAAADDTYSTLKNQTLVVVAPGVLSNDDDPEADDLFAIKISNPASGSVVLGANGELTYSPPSDWTGTTSFTYQAFDGELYSPITTVTINVNESNLSPTDILLSNNSIPENSGVNAVIGQLSTVDPDALDSFDYTLVSGAGDGDNTSFNIFGDQLRASEDFDFETKNVYTIRVRSTDQDDEFVEKSFTIYITNVNEAPVANNQTVSTDENEPIAITLSGDDEDGDDFSFVLVSSPSEGILSWTPPVVTYTPDDWFVGFDSFEFKVIDEHGVSSNTATITIEVVDVDQAPTDIHLLNNTILENSGINAVVGTLSTEDPDPLDTFTYSLVPGVGDDDNASFNILGDQLRASEDFDFESKKEYTIRVRSTDTADVTMWTEKAFTILVLDVNDPPVAYDQEVFTEEDLPVEIILVGFDEDGDALTYDPSNPEHGTLTGTAPNLVYTPDPDFTGTDSFSFTASDGENQSDTATVTIIVGAKAFEDYFFPLFNFNTK